MTDERHHPISLKPPHDFREHPALRDVYRLHRVTRGRPHILVAVLDGPVDVSHLNFRGSRLTRVEGEFGHGSEAGDATRHGTHVASVIFGHSGIAPGCSGLAIPVYREDGDGRVMAASQETLARAIHRALDAGAQLINVSGGQLTPTGEAQPDLLAAVRRCHRKNVLVVAAAGNDGCACLHVPGALPSVLAVAAADSDGCPLPSSNWSGPYQTQGILAPGEHIAGALPGGGMTQGSGSSYATAVTTGTAALMLSVQLERGLSDAHAVRRAILTTVSQCDPARTANCHRHLAGHLNPRAAMSLTIQGEHSMFDESTASQNLDGVSSANMPSAVQTAPTIEAASATEAVLPSSAIDEPAPGTPGQAIEDAGVEPSDCACGGAAAPQLAYALGQIDFDFGTVENFDWFKQNARVKGNFINPNDPAQILAYLDENPEFASTLIWTLNVAGVPVYAITAEDRFREAVYLRLRQFLAAQVVAEEQRQVSISTCPARIHGGQRLLNGAVVPALAPDPRGMFNFTETDLISNIQALLGLEEEPTEAQKKHVQSFLSYVVGKIRNLGRADGERALNFLAIQGYLTLLSLHASNDPDVPDNVDDFRLLDVTAKPSAFCRPGGNCQDVSLTLFDPCSPVNTATLVFRQTVDVAAAIPVLVGQPATFRTR